MHRGESRSKHAHVLGSHGTGPSLSANPRGAKRRSCPASTSPEPAPAEPDPGTRLRWWSDDELGFAPHVVVTRIAEYLAHGGARDSALDEPTAASGGFINRHRIQERGEDRRPSTRGRPLCGACQDRWRGVSLPSRGDGMSYPALWLEEWVPSAGSASPLRLAARAWDGRDRALPTRRTQYFTRRATRSERAARLAKLSGKYT